MLRLVESPGRLDNKFVIDGLDALDLASDVLSPGLLLLRLHLAAQRDLAIFDLDLIRIPADIAILREFHPDLVVDAIIRLRLILGQENRTHE